VIKSSWLLAASLLLASSAVTAENTRNWAISEFGTPLYADAPASLPYANADAPKGGRIVLGDFGSFDTLNFHVAKGEWPSSIGLIYDSLMESTDDELDAYYGVLAESVEYPEDKSWAIFHLRPEARYHDGSSVIAADFVYSLEAKKEHGRPMIKAAYENVLSAEAVDDHTVKFVFASGGSMKPITQVAGLSPLPADFWSTRDITKASLDIPKTSGAYRIKNIDPGRAITYERVKDYWAADLPLKKGLHNFDEIRYDYYRDETVMFEAFKAGKLELRVESSAKRWVKEYDLPQVKEKKIFLEEVPTESPRGMFGLFFNVKKENFQDRRVREALVKLFDFESMQRSVLYGKFKRLNTYFNGAGYSSSGVPEGRELEMLEPFRDQLPAELFEQPFALTVTDGSGRDRRGKRAALQLLKQAGWELKNGKLLNQAGRGLELEIMTGWPDAEKFVSQYLDTLKGLGVDAKIRVVDSAQWRARVNESDFDVLVSAFNFFVPPGNELKSFYHSSFANEPAGNNTGINDPAVDAMIEAAVAATTLEEQQSAMHALDRVMLWQHYSIPLYYRSNSWVAYWDRFGRPERAPRYKLGVTSTWWAK